MIKFVNLLVITLPLLTAGVICLPIIPGLDQSDGYVTETPTCLSVHPTNATRCIPDTKELFCIDITSAACECPVGYFCHFQDLDLCYFSCEKLPDASEAIDFNMNMLRGSEVPVESTAMAGGTARDQSAQQLTTVAGGP